MQFRSDEGSGVSGPGLSFRRPGPGPSFPAPPLRVSFPVDYGPRVDDRRYTVQVPSRQQLPSLKSSQGDDQEEAPPSRHLWVGNVSQEVTEGLLVEKFSKFGSIESVTVYSQRNYAFINFRYLENARDAKNGLQGVVLGGLSMRIEFAKGAKPSRHLWVGGIGQTVSREEIEGEFKRFGMMEDFKFLRDRNCAFVDYEKIEDAVAAVDSLNRKRLGDEELRVDFGRSQPPKRETPGRPGTAISHEDWAGPHSRDGRDHPDQFRGPAELYRGISDVRHSERGASGDSFSIPSDGYQAGSGPGTTAAGSGRSRGDKEEPSDVLWVGFPLLSKVDEEGLRRAFAPYGEVERVKTFPGRTYAFVQFKNVEEASRAKIALEGKLFNDPRVHIRFSNSEIGPVDNPRSDLNYFSPSQGKDAAGFSEKVIGRIVGSDRFGTVIPPLRSTGLRPEYFPGGLARGVALARAAGSGTVINLGRGGGLLPGGTDARMPLGERDYQTGSQGGRGQPGTGARPGGTLPFEEQWDIQDEELNAREPKRLRMLHGGSSDTLSPSIYQGGRRYSGSDSFATGPDINREGYGPLPSSRKTGYGNEYSEVPGGPRIRLGSLQLERSGHAVAGQGHMHSAAALGAGPAGGFTGVGKREVFSTDSGVTGVNEGWRWHGTIAKGGTPVCRARCLPVGRGIDVTVPDVVNCTARTDLDMLAKHVYQAGDFGVVFFVPEADPDVPPYHDFMHYLGEKHRAGVAKLMDGTTLFLVPPSEFSEKVLKVPGNNCLFGVVLKAQQPSPVGHAQLQQQLSAPAPQHLPPFLLHSPQQQVVSHQQQHGQSRGLVLVNGLSTRDNGAFPAPPIQKVQSSALTATGTTLVQSQLTNLAGGLPTVLTPELIASLTALLPTQNQLSGTVAPPRLSGLSILPPPLREGISGGGPTARISSNSGSTNPASATMDNRTTHRPSQSHQQSLAQSQGWPSVQLDQQPGNGGHMPVPPEQGSVYAMAPQQPQAANVSHIQPHTQQSPGPTQQGYSGVQSQGSMVPGYPGQQLVQQTRPTQNPPLQLGGAPLLPSDQLAQLTALLTQRQQQPAQQQQAAQLLQQHFQQQPLHAVPQEHQQAVPLSTQQPQLQQQHYTLQASSQQQWAGGPLPHHLPQSIGHAPVLSGGWDGAMAIQGQQPQPPPAVPQQPQIPLTQPHVQQLMPTGGVTGEQVGGTSQDDTERQKRFQATLQLAAALLQQMQHQQTPGQGNPDQQ